MVYNTSYKTKMCLAEFKGFAQLCLCRRVRIRNFVFPALVTAFLPRALFGFGVFKMRRVLVRKVPIVQTTGFNRPAKFLIVLKYGGYDNFLLNRFHGLSKSPAIPFSQVSADSFRFNIQKCSRSLHACIAFRPTCFARCLVTRNLHETSTQRAR